MSARDRDQKSEKVVTAEKVQEITDAIIESLANAPEAGISKRRLNVTNFNTITRTLTITPDLIPKEVDRLNDLLLEAEKRFMEKRSIVLPKGKKIPDPVYTSMPPTGILRQAFAFLRKPEPSRTKLVAGKSIMMRLPPPPVGEMVIHCLLLFEKRGLITITKSFLMPLEGWSGPLVVSPIHCVSAAEAGAGGGGARMMGEEEPIAVSALPRVGAGRDRDRAASPHGDAKGKLALSIDISVAGDAQEPELELRGGGGRTWGAEEESTAASDGQGMETGEDELPKRTLRREKPEDYAYDPEREAVAGEEEQGNKGLESEIHQIQQNAKSLEEKLKNYWRESGGTAEPNISIRSSLGVTTFGCPKVAAPSTSAEEPEDAAQPKKPANLARGADGGDGSSEYSRSR